MIYAVDYKTAGAKNPGKYVVTVRFDNWYDRNLPCDVTDMRMLANSLFYLADKIEKDKLK